jgi:Zn-dependent protease
MKCRKCGEETFLPFRCPYCGDNFCTAHRLPEYHNCPRMELARARVHEDAVASQGPGSYEYKVTYGMPRRVKGRVYFSPKELKHLAVAALLVMGVGLSYVLFAGSSSQNWTMVLSVLAIVLTVSFFVHELAHKITAQRRGLWAEFRLTTWGAILTLVFMILPVTFKIISPGAVMISGSASLDEIGKISIAGPMTNIILSSALLGAAFIWSALSWVFVLVALLNGYIAVFNLIPFGIFDGFKIFGWNKTVWALAFTVSATLTAFSYILATGYLTL